MKSAPWRVGLSFLLLLACEAGNADETSAADATNGSTGDGDGDGDGEGGGCSLEGDWPAPPGNLAAGESCEYHGDCQSRYCARWQDVPKDPARSCEPPPAFPNMRITGTVYDMLTGAKVSDANIKIVGALGAVANPIAAKSLANAVSDSDARFDVEACGVHGEPIGIVAITQQEGPEGYFLTSTGLGEPYEESGLYLAGNDIHDIWLVPAAKLVEWSTLLEPDPAFADYLPLGEQGGIVGLVRDDNSGEPIAGATVNSREAPADTFAVVRYLDDDGQGFNAVATGSSGLFVIIAPDLGEGFEAWKAGQQLGSNVGGSVKKSIFSMLL